MPSDGRTTLTVDLKKERRFSARVDGSIPSRVPGGVAYTLTNTPALCQPGGGSGTVTPIR